MMWTYLIKPHSQQTTIKFLSNAIDCIIPEFSDATYTGQLHSKLSHPEEVKEMLKICHLGTSNATIINESVHLKIAFLFLDFLI